LRRDSYAGKKISVNKGPCSFPGELNCTDLVNFKSGIENELFWIANKVGGVTITGGTEIDSHARNGFSHPNGYKFDLRLTSQLDTYIRVNFSTCPTRGDGSACYRNTATEAYYYREGDHWDVVKR